MAETHGIESEIQIDTMQQSVNLKKKRVKKLVEKQVLKDEKWEI